MSQVQVLETPIKSEGDKKDYRAIKLPNGLRALLIKRNEETSTDGDQEILAAANLTVGVGSFDEPSNIGGLAHFLEHMLFMGSKKYPEEAGYNQFITANGGSNNAMTENEYTTYFFDVSEKVLPEALDRFAQLFISPLLLKDALQRERQAVDSEFEMATAQDQIRMNAFIKSLIHENHPASFFDYGNLKTLKDNITDDELYDALRNFFVTKYVSNNMFLSIQTTRSLDDMQALVVELFSGIKSGVVTPKPLRAVDEIFKPEFYNKMYFVKPKKDTKTLAMTFCIDSVDAYYKCRPLSYIKAIFGNQGEGGIGNYLKEKKLAISTRLVIDAQAFEANSMFALVKISVSLTDYGLQNIDLVLKEIYSYLLMIKETSVVEHRRLYNDYKEKNEVDFKFHTESEATSNVVKGTIGMKYFDEIDVLRGDALYQGFDEKVIFNIINAMNQRKFNLVISTSKHEKFDKKEEYFGVEYDELDFPEQYQRLWDERTSNPEFFLEKPNPFKATNFEIFENEKESPKHPVNIFENEIFEVWHKLDKKYKVPRATIKIYVISPRHMTSSYNSLLLKLYEKIMIFMLSKKVFAAFSAGLSISSSAHRKGFQIEFSGFNEKIHMLVDLTTKSLKQVADEVDQATFDTQKAEIKKNYGNSLLNPGTLSINYTSKTLTNEYWSTYDCYQDIEKVSLEDMQMFIQKFFRKTKIQILVQGNMTKDQSLEIVTLLERNLSCQPLDTEYELKARGYKLPVGTNVLRLKSLMLNDDNSSLKILYQIGPKTVRLVCLLRLLEGILDTKAFDYLRSREQLGYSVGVQVGSDGDILALSVFVKSQEHKHPFSEVYSKLEIFMNEIAKKVIDELTDEEFESFKEARIKMLSSEDLDLDSEIDRNWHEISGLTYMFDRVELSIKVTKSVTKADLQEFFKSFTQPNNARKLSLQIIGNQNSPTTSETNLTDRQLDVEFMTERISDNESLITDIAAFQEKLHLYPVVLSQI